jgi:hypothetical protein
MYSAENGSDAATIAAAAKLNTVRYNLRRRDGSRADGVGAACSVIALMLDSQ